MYICISAIYIKNWEHLTSKRLLLLFLLKIKRNKCGINAGRNFIIFVFVLSSVGPTFDLETNKEVFSPGFGSRFF